MRHIRHGDVFLREVKVNPAADSKEVKVSVLAEGETTGHKHLLVAEKPMYEWGKGLERFIKLDSPATLDHAEHGLITIPKNKEDYAWEISIQRVYTPEEIRNVAD